jgi:hypothetical protein
MTTTNPQTLESSVESMDPMQTYNGYCSDYKLNIKLTPEKLIIDGEHRLTQQLYHVDIEQQQCEHITDGLCPSPDQLFELIHELLENRCGTNRGEQSQRSLAIKVDNEGKTIELRINVTIVFGTNRKRNWDFSILLKKVQLDDIMRMERIITDLCRRIEQLESRVSLPTSAKPLKRVKFQTPVVNTLTLSNDDLTCINPAQAHRELSVDQSFLDGHDRWQKISFKWNTAPNENSYVGVMQGVSTNAQSAGALQSEHAWFLRIYNGTTFSKQYQYRPYTVVAKLGSVITIVLDTQTMLLSFHVDIDCENRWAFQLPTTLKPSELVPLILVHGANESVTIHAETS